MERDKSRKTVLVVDNHPLMLTYMRRLLEKRGDRVITAEDGLSALKRLSNERPDVIFVDQVMPNISGDKLCRIIRSRPEFKDTCLIVLSAIAAEADFSFSEFGANYCIAKGPFDKMSTHILALLYKLDAEGRCGFSDQIIGREDVYYRQISKELLYSKRHAEMILHHIEEGVVELTSGGDIIYVNPTAANLLGKSDVELLGAGFVDLFSDADRNRVNGLLETASGNDTAAWSSGVFRIGSTNLRVSAFRLEDEPKSALSVIIADLTDASPPDARPSRAVSERLRSIVRDADAALAELAEDPARLADTIAHLRRIVERLDRTADELDAPADDTSTG